MNSLNQFSDQFGKLIADPLKNKVGLSAAKEFDPQKWRVHYNGTRRYIRYGNNSNFADNDDYYTLTPASGDTITMRTAEHFQYVPQYVVRPSFAVEVNQSLQSGDKITISYGEADLNNSMASADGWILEFVPGLEDDECYFSIYRDGTIKSNGGNKTKVSLKSLLTYQRRFAIDLNWYNVGSAIFKETFTDSNGHQKNINQAEIGVEQDRGPSSPTQPIEFSFTSGGNSTELRVGSTGFVILGSPEPKVRVKRAIPTVSITTTGSYEPLIAFQNQDREIKTSILSADIFTYSANDDVHLLACTFGSEKVNFGGGDSWSPPENLGSFETALRSRTDVSGVADLDGTVGGSNGVGGSQKFKSTQLSSGQGSNIQTEKTTAADIKNQLYFEDILVILGESATTGDLTFTFDYEEE